MSIGFMGDGKPSNNNQPKRPRGVRGYKTKKIVTEHYGRKDVSWERVPRSGYGSAFFSLFTIFVAVLVLFNVVFGTGYKGYKVATLAIYGITETVGGVITSTAKLLTETSAQTDGFLDDNEFITGDVIQNETPLYVKIRRNIFFGWEYYKVIYRTLIYDGNGNFAISNGQTVECLVVLESSWSKIPINTTIIPFTSAILGDKVLCISYLPDDEGQPAFRNRAKHFGDVIKWISQEEYLEKTKE